MKILRQKCWGILVTTIVVAVFLSATALASSESFIESLEPYLQIVREAGLDPATFLAQSGLETGWGRSEAVKYHNYYGRNTATDDYRGTADAIRSELRQAAETNRSLQADNDRLRKNNSQLGTEIGESRRLASSIGDNNRETGARLEEAGNIVADCQRISGEIRKGNQDKNKQSAP